MTKYDIELKWLTRPEQDLIGEKFKKLVESKKKFFILEAPTGIGKSYSAVLMCHYFNSLHPESKFDILTNTKILQDQYVEDFPFMREIKGKENYRCHVMENGGTCSEGLELNRIGDIHCENCTYKTARNEYQECSIGVLNFSMFFAFQMYSPDVVESRKSKVLFIDECHSFEENYCAFVESYVSVPYLSSLEIDVTKEVVSALKNIETKQDYGNFLSTYVVKPLGDKIESIENIMKNSTSKHEKKSVLEKYRKLSRTKCKFNRFLKDQKNWKSNWFIDSGVDDQGDTYHKVSVVWGTPYLKEIYDKYDHIVMMSGTIVDKVMFSSLMDLDKEQTSFLTLDSPFDPENRVIYYKPEFGKMSYNNISETYPLLFKEVLRIAKKHDGYKGLIHTGNYKIAGWIYKDLQNQKQELKDRFLFHHQKNKEEVIQHHYNNEKDTIIVSPAIVNGVDMKDDRARFQIIMKMPYPSLDSKFVKLRMNSNMSWYNWKTMTDLCQMCGRSVRNTDDWANTYIIDSSFSTLRNRTKLPRYIEEAIR